MIQSINIAGSSASNFLDTKISESSKVQSPLETLKSRNITGVHNYFDTSVGKEVRAMNQQSLAFIKGKEPVFPVSKTIEDKEVLLSNNPENVKKWTYWVNPKTGKMYTVIKKKNNEDGTVTARVLDADGNLVKEADVVPKKIIIVDNFLLRGEHALDFGAHFNLSHKDIVKLHIERNNPLAEIDCYNIGDTSEDEMSYELYLKTFQDILDRVENGEQIDAINCSFASEYKDGKNCFSKCSKEEAIKMLLSANGKNEKIDEIIPLLEKLTSKGVRIVFAAGNDSKDAISFELSAKGIDVVGSLNGSGKVSDFSSARRFAQHYEKGEYRYRALENGINLTDKKGPDIPYKGTPYEQFAGKKPEDFLISDEELKEFHQLEELYKDGKMGRMEYAHKRAAYGDKLFRLKDSVKKFDLSKADKSAELFYYPKHSLLLTTTSEGYLVPYMQEKGYSGTSFSTPVRTAKIVLNNAMQEILNT